MQSTNVTPLVELQRVQRIHAQLDRWAWEVRASHTSFALNALTPQQITFTADEVRDWPRIKTAMIAHANTPQLRHLNVAWTGAGSTLFKTELLRSGDADCAAAVARGLCFYSEMLPPLPDLGGGSTGRVLEAALEPDPYNPHGLTELQRLHAERGISGYTDGRWLAREARERNAVALAAETPRQRKPSRFDPRPGIDDRGGFSSASWEE